MPELPEVETVRRALTPTLENHFITNVFVGREDLRWPLPLNLESHLKGRQIIFVSRRGKYLLITLNDKNTLLLHLGMSGSIRIHEELPALNKHDHIMLSVSDDPNNLSRINAHVVFNDPRRFGWVDLFAEVNTSDHKLLKNIGVEPLSNEFSADYLEKIFKRRQAPIKNALLNQSLIAGIGNIYASESLFYAGISPRRKAYTITGKRAKRLAEAIVKTLLLAIEAGGTSLRDHIQPGGEIGYFKQRLAVYGRAGEPCFFCKNKIKTFVQLGRSSFYCSRCQR